MKKIGLYFFVSIISTHFAFADDQVDGLKSEASKVIVHIAGIKNNKGDVFVELYSDPKTFRKSALAYKVIKAKAQEGLMTFTYDEVNPGHYAILAFHDEDGNGSLNKRFGMIPTEGYALSNNPKVFGPPAFNDSSFEVPINIELNLPMHYQ